MRLFRDGRTNKEPVDFRQHSVGRDAEEQGERTRTASADPAGVRNENKAVKSTGEARRESVGSGPLHERQGEVEKEVEAPGQAEEEGRAVCFDPALNPEGAHGVARFTSVRAKEKREKNICDYDI